MHSTFLIGNDVVLDCEIRNADTDELFDPESLTLYIEDPAGVVVTIPMGSLTHPSAGIFSYTCFPNQVGNWKYKFLVTGARHSAEEDYFTVKDTRVPT